MELLERASVLDELDGVLAALLAAGNSRERLFAALLDELDQGTRPQVVVVEDAHWADDATLDLLRFSPPARSRGHPDGRHLPGRRGRPPAPRAVARRRPRVLGPVRRPRLAPLSRRGVAALAELERLSARPLAAAVARKLRGLGLRGLARGPRPATSANPANLTAGETEVVALVTEGLRNADIARPCSSPHDGRPPRLRHPDQARRADQGRGGPSPEAIRRAAEVNQLPVDRITEVRLLDPYFYR
jgi:hypothetical protein